MQNICLRLKMTMGLYFILNFHLLLILNLLAAAGTDQYSHLRITTKGDKLPFRIDFPINFENGSISNFE